MVAEKIIADTAPLATLIELILIRNKLTVRKHLMRANGNNAEQFDVPANVTPEWLDEQIAIERRLLRKSPESRVTFNNMTLQNGRNVYSNNPDNTAMLRTELRQWVKQIAARYIERGIQTEREKADHLMEMLNDSSKESVMGVFEEILNWEGGLD